MNFLINSPMDQFQLVPLFSIRFGFADFSFTNSSFFMMMGLGFFLLLCHMIQVNGNGTLVPSRWQTVIESFYTLIQGLARDSIGPKSNAFFPFVFVLFMFVMCCNVIGMIPYSFTATSHLVLTFTVALGIFLGRTYIMVSRHGPTLLDSSCHQELH
jgi:ATP synthase subunit 6